MKYRKVSDKEMTFSRTKIRHPSEYHSVGHDGSQIKPFTENITALYIPAECQCTWNYINGRWHLKFRHALCLKAREHQ